MVFGARTVKVCYVIGNKELALKKVTVKNKTKRFNANVFLFDS